MIHILWLVLVCLLYAGLLFWIAYNADKRRHVWQKSSVVYSLSLLVYCSTWTLFGVLGQASTEGWSFVAIYIGPVLLLLLGRRWLFQLIGKGKALRTTSIADFIASRYGNAHFLARLVTVIAILAAIPYIALQLRAVSLGFEILTGASKLQSKLPFYQDNAFYVSLFMAAFAIVFGTRKVDAAAGHSGVVAMVAFESLVKLLVVIAVGLWVMFAVFDSPQALWHNAQQQLAHSPLLHGDFWSMSLLTQSLLAALAMFLLPRQFQMMVVENQEPRHILSASWLVPLYLLLMMLMVVPIALAGKMLLPFANGDGYLMSLPLFSGNSLLALLAFIGGASAATSMIIVSTLAVSTMVASNMVLPIFFQSAALQDIGSASLSAKSHQQVKNMVLNARRVAIFFMVLLSYLFYRALGEIESLAYIGLLSFAAIAQCAPALIGGMVWTKGNRFGATLGMLAGIALWFSQLLLPALWQVPVDHHSILGQLFYQQQLWDDFTTGVLLSLTVNVLTYIFVSQVTEPSVRERLAAGDFLHSHDYSPEFICKIDDLEVVLERVLGAASARDFLDKQLAAHNISERAQNAPKSMMSAAEQILSSAVGAASTRVIFSTILGRENLHINDITTLASETHQVLAMSRSQLQTALENLHQGVCVIDQNLHLVAWNQRYVQIYDYPEGFIYHGQPVEDIIGFNSRRGLCGAGEVGEHIQRRMAHMRRGTAHEYERELPDGTVIFMQGRLMPNGGYVTSFTDITAYRQAASSLQQANVVLEQKIEQNTRELAQLTARLIDANTNKTRFLAAASHDLIQPVSAAKLFASALAQKGLGAEQLEILSHLEGALGSAEEVIGVLAEISKLDAGAMVPKFSHFALERVLQPLVDEFTAIASDAGLTLDYRHHGAWWTYGDAHFLKRMVQNLLANAIRYTEKGRVLLSVRARNNQLWVEVRDTGIGIPEQDFDKIFEEFNRLGQRKNSATSLGLGLAIVKRMSVILNQPISVFSKVGVGTCFRLILPKIDAPKAELGAPHQTKRDIVEPCKDLRILCIDNDAAVLTAMKVLLQSWQSRVYAYNALAAVPDDLPRPDVLIVDYQLDDGDTGIAVLQSLQRRFDIEGGVLVSASSDADLPARAQAAGCYFLHKPLKPAALRAILRKMAS